MVSQTLTGRSVAAIAAAPAAYGGTSLPDTGAPCRWRFLLSHPPGCFLAKAAA